MKMMIMNIIATTERIKNFAHRKNMIRVKIGNWHLVTHRLLGTDFLWANTNGDKA